METRGVGYLGGREVGEGSARQVGDFVGDQVPDAVKFLRGGLRRRLDRMAVNDQRIQVDHLDVVVEGCEDVLAGDRGRESGYGCEDGAFGHGGGDTSAALYDGTR